jgi:hypothetical protein
MGTLISHTIIAAAPGGQSLTLGIAKHKSGAQTLCRVIGDIRGNGNERVFIISINGLVYVYGRRTRVRRMR